MEVPNNQTKPNHEVSNLPPSRDDAVGNNAHQSDLRGGHELLISSTHQIVVHIHHEDHFNSPLPSLTSYIDVVSFPQFVIYIELDPSEISMKIIIGHPRKSGSGSDPTEETSVLICAEKIPLSTYPQQHFLFFYLVRY